MRFATEYNCKTRRIYYVYRSHLDVTYVSLNI